MNPHSSSGIHALTFPDSHRAPAFGWLLLGILALAGAGLFAVLLVLARTPQAQLWLPGIDLFRIALVVHVDLSVLVWFLAGAGFLWSLLDGGAGYWGRLALGTASAGMLLMVAAPFVGSGTPSLNNYVPVLDGALFLTGLGLFGTGVVLRAAAFVVHGGATVLRTPAGAGGLLAAVAVLVAAMILLDTWSVLPGGAHDSAWYEVLFWGSGHVLQFAYAALAMVAWLWLAEATGLRVGLSRRAAVWLLLSGLLPVAAAVVLQLVTEPGSTAQRLGYTRLMQWGGLWPSLPIGVLVAWAWWRGLPAPPALVPVRRALLASLLLFGTGGVIGGLISGLNTVIPAHYHGSIAGVTLALMGLTYLLLPQLGFAPVEGRIARWQPVVYAAGQLLYVTGLAWSGYLGIQRKTAGVAQGLDSAWKSAAMGLSGLGGLLAIVGGLLFIVVCYRAIRVRSRG